MRDNSKRVGATAQPAPEKPQTLDFSTPTELVDLPSKGRFYPEAHPLYGQEVVEIKFMTAKDEDILTSPSFLKKGIAIDRLIQNVLLDSTIKVESLLSGDKAAIMLASRINGFGPEYRTMVSCSACSQATENVFNLSAVENYHGDDYEEFDVSDTGKGTYLIKTPRTKFDVEVRMLTSKDESIMIERMRSMNEKSETNTGYTDQLKMIIVSVDGVTARPLINKFAESLPMFDARYIRTAYSRLNPSPKMKQEFECPSCGQKKEVEIPMTVNFFWSDQ